MRLAEVLRDLPVGPPSRPGGSVSSFDAEVSGVSYDSRRTSAGDVFVAWRGERRDGRTFAGPALDAGAVAVIAWAEPPEELRSRLEDDGVPWLVAEAPRALLGPIAARLLGHPERELDLVGVTGTNGKTTTAWIVQHLLEAVGTATGLVGTLGYRYDDHQWDGGRTTPEGSDLMRMLRGMRDAGAEAVVLEVSSHALVQGRVSALGLRAAAFTNLTRDHLDFHGDLESYYRAKASLFDLLQENGVAVVCVSDEISRRLASELRAQGRRVLTVGEGGDVEALEAVCRETGTEARVKTPSGEIRVRSPLLGRFHLWNLLTAIGVLEALDRKGPSLEEAIASITTVPGRMEPIRAGQEFPAVVDYAHTEDGLESVLEALAEITPRKIALVFGCGGDRDRGKRAGMGRIAGQLADLPIATNDNPRSEDPFEILREVEAGLKESGNRKYKIIPDRREAIHRAVTIAAGRPDWCVLVAGKGHEEGQEIGGEVRPFSDRREIVAAVEELLGQATNG